jgi:hypothetical protein
VINLIKKPSPPKPKTNPLLETKLKAAEQRNKKLTRPQRAKLEAILAVLESDRFYQFYKDSGEFENYLSGDLTHALHQSTAPGVNSTLTAHSAAQEIMFDKLAGLFNKLI